MKIFLIFAFIFQVSIFAGGDWLLVNSPTTQKLTRVTFFDSLYGYVSGDSGAFYKTTNGGVSWDLVEIGSSLSISDHFFLDKRTGWAAVTELDSVTFIGYSTLFYTDDSGSSWQDTPFIQEDLFITKLHFFDSLNGVAGGGRGELFYTGNSGFRWDFASFDTNSTTGFRIIDFTFLNDQFGFACGGQFDAAGTLYRTTDGGKMWWGQLVNSEPVHSVQIFDSLHSLAFTGDFDYGTSILKSSNTGLSWVRDTVNFFGIPEASAKRTAREIWSSLGFTGQLLYTEDSMQTWHTMFLPDTIRVNDITFSDTLNGFAVGDYGRIYKFIYKEPVSVHESEPKKISGFKVESYPNPFNPSTTIQYFLPERSMVHIKLYDILGREVSRLFNGEQAAGIHRQVINASALSAGVYICTITAGKEASYIKLLYLK